jgi:signal transduction histidine kinase/DNA-binding response OmpR family regulator
MTTKDTDFLIPDDLAYLRKESLGPVMYCVLAVLFAWYVVVFHPTNWIIEPTAWIPMVLLAFGLLVAFLVKERNLSLASAILILSIAATILCLMWLTGMKVVPYLLAIVISLTGLLFSMRTVVWVTVGCDSLVVIIGVLRWAYSPISSELLAPVLVISAVGILSSLTVRNLYMTLSWTWDRALEAQQIQKELQDRQGELTRTLKALDEAYHRLGHLNYDLAWARELAERARLTKQQFAANVSHELRTPLNVILAFSEMMYFSPESYNNVLLPPEYRGDVREVYRSCKHLLSLVDDVLDLSQIEIGQMKLDPKPTRLHRVVTEALGIIRPLVRGKEIELQTHLPVNLPLVLVDRNRVRQVLVNLLNNARRFTEQGRIMVEAVREAEYVRITVTDTGIGIPLDKQKDVFKEFRQIDSAAFRSEDGSGLGLAISKRFIEMHGGRIWLESEGIPGRGSRFHFTLPLARTQSVELPTSRQRWEPPLRQPTGRSRTLLLLDQNPTVVQMLKQGLEAYQIVPVDEVSTVPGLIDELHPRAVVLNLAQKQQAGQQMRLLRQQLAYSSVPVVLCPLVSEQQLRQSLGVIDYLVKPVTYEGLLALLERLDGDIRRILLIDDDPRMTHLLSRMLDTAAGEYEVSQAYNGQEGLRQMRHKRPDLVLMDLTMPEIDGWTMLARMQQEPELSHIPVAAITAHTPTLEEERQLGGNMMFLFNQGGFTNEEVITYLRHLLEATHVPSPLQRNPQVVEHI